MSLSFIHPTAVIEKGAQIASTASIGAFSYIGPEVVIEEDVQIFSHVSLTGITYIGAGTKLFPFVTLGYPPQSLDYRGEPTRIMIGNNNVIREHVTIHPGTAMGKGQTRLGNNNFIMIGCHIAHDCLIGNHVIFANNSILGGHVIVEDHVRLGGMVAVHQRVRIGAHAIVGGMSGVESDVIPYGLVRGERAVLSGLNLVGLKRKGFSKEIIYYLRQAYQKLFDSGDRSSSLAQRVEEVQRDFGHCNEVLQLLQFIQGQSDRHLCLPKTS